MNKAKPKKIEWLTYCKTCGEFKEHCGCKK